MNNIYIIHFGMGQKAMKAYECPLPVLSFAFNTSPAGTKSEQLMSPIELVCAV